uniref:Uncharacterized protein n=1 Tax=Anguilla anguilla TaxID=7936 RepID=A0A0E9RTZ2_ANGAN
MYKRLFIQCRSVVSHLSFIHMIVFIIVRIINATCVTFHISLTTKCSVTLSRRSAVMSRTSFQPQINFLRRNMYITFQ